MARYRIQAEIYVEGPEVNEANDVYDSLDEMLGAYSDMTETTSDTSINIYVQKIFKNE